MKEPCERDGNYCCLYFFIRNYFAGTKNNTYLCKQKVGCGFTAHEDNSTRLAYRKICRRVIFLYILWQIKNHVPFRNKSIY